MNTFWFVWGSTKTIQVCLCAYLVLCLRLILFSVVTTFRPTCGTCSSFGLVSFASCKSSLSVCATCRLQPWNSMVLQQVLEALCMLVALRTWKNYWLGKRVTLTVRTDNIATLTMICKMQPHSAQLGTWVAYQVCSNRAHQWAQ